MHKRVCRYSEEASDLDNQNSSTFDPRRNKMAYRKLPQNRVLKERENFEHAGMQGLSSGN